MIRALTCLSAALMALAAPAAERTPPVRRLAETPFERAWDLPLGSGAHIGWWNHRLPETVFVQVEDGRAVYAIETMTGLTRWVSQPLPELIKPSVFPGASRFTFRADNGAEQHEDRLWLVSQERLFSLDGSSGHVVWSWLLPYSPSTGFVAQGRGESLRVTSGDWEGRTRTLTYHEGKSLPYELWQWNMLTSVTAMPAVADDQIYVGDHEGVVSAFKPDRERVWATDLGGPVRATPLPRGQLLYVGNDDHVISALNRFSGERLAHIVLDGPILRAPFAYAAEPERLYAWVHHEDAGRRGLQAIKVQPDRVPFTGGDGRSPTLPPDRNPPPLDTVRMSREWFLAGITAVVASTPEHLMVKREGDDLIHALNRRRGAIDWSWNPGEQQDSSAARVTVIEYQDPSDLVRTIFTINPRGQFIAYRLQGYKPAETRQATEDRIAELVGNRAREKAAEGPKPAEPAK